MLASKKGAQKSVNSAAGNVTNPKDALSPSDQSRSQKRSTTESPVSNGRPNTFRDRKVSDSEAESNHWKRASGRNGARYHRNDGKRRNKAYNNNYNGRNRNWEFVRQGGDRNVGKRGFGHDEHFAERLYPGHDAGNHHHHKYRQPATTATACGRDTSRPGTVPRGMHRKGSSCDDIAGRLQSPSGDFRRTDDECFRTSSGIPDEQQQQRQQDNRNLTEQDSYSSSLEALQEMDRASFDGSVRESDGMHSGVQLHNADMCMSFGSLETMASFGQQDSLLLGGCGGMLPSKLSTEKKQHSKQVAPCCKEPDEYSEPQSSVFVSEAELMPMFNTADATHEPAMYQEQHDQDRSQQSWNCVDNNSVIVGDTPSTLPIAAAPGTFMVAAQPSSTGSEFAAVTGSGLEGPTQRRGCYNVAYAYSTASVAELNASYSRCLFTLRRLLEACTKSFFVNSNDNNTSAGITTTSTTRTPVTAPNNWTSFHVATSLAWIHYQMEILQNAADCMSVGGDIGLACMHVRELQRVCDGAAAMSAVPMPLRLSLMSVSHSTVHEAAQWSNSWLHYEEDQDCCVVT